MAHNVQKLGVVHVVDGVVGAEDPQLLLHAVVHERLAELHAEALHHKDDLVDVHARDDLDVVEDVLNAVPRDDGHRRERVRPGPDLDLVHGGDEGQHVVHPGLGDGLHEGAEPEVDADAALVHLVERAEEDGGEDGDEEDEERDGELEDGGW